MKLRHKIVAVLAALFSLVLAFGTSLSASATPVVVTSIPTGTGSVPVAMSGDGTRVYSSDYLGSLKIIDSSNNQILNTTTIAGITNLFVLQASPNSNVLYALDSRLSSSKVFVINVSGDTPTITTTITVGANAKSMAVSPDGSKIYVGNNGSSDNSISVIDTASSTVVATIAAPNAPVTAGARLDAPWGIAVSPDNTKVFISYYDDDVSPTTLPGLAKLDAATNTFDIVKEFADTVHPRGLAITSNGQSLYMANFGTSTSGQQWIERFQTSNLASAAQTPTVTQSSAVLRYPTEIALSADDSTLFVAFGPGSGTSGAVNVYSTSGMTPTTLQLTGAGNASYYIAAARGQGAHFAYVGSATVLFLIGEYISLQRQTLSGNTGTSLSSSALTASGFTGTVTYSISPSLPSGFTFNTSTGVITGSSGSAFGPSSFTITGTDGSTTAVATVTLTVTAPGGNGGGSSSELANTGNKSQLPVALIGLMFLFSGIAVYSGSVVIQRRNSN